MKIRVITYLCDQKGSPERGDFRCTVNSMITCNPNTITIQGNSCVCDCGGCGSALLVFVGSHRSPTKDLKHKSKQITNCYKRLDGQ